MHKMDRMLRRKGFVNAISLLPVLAVIFLVYNILTWFGLSYIFTKNDISDAEWAVEGAYTQTKVTKLSPSLMKDARGAYYAAPCKEDGAYIIYIKTEDAEKLVKKVKDGKSFIARGKVEKLQNEELASLEPLVTPLKYYSNPVFFKHYKLNYMSFGEYFAKHKILNIITLVLLFFITAAMLVFMIRGADGKLRRTAKRFGYNMDDIRYDFETAERFGKMYTGSKFIMLTSALNAEAIAVSDVETAYKRPVKTKSGADSKKFGVVLYDKKGREHEVVCRSEKQANKLMEALGRYENIIQEQETN